MKKMILTLILSLYPFCANADVIHGPAQPEWNNPDDSDNSVLCGPILEINTPASPGRFNFGGSDIAALVGMKLSKGANFSFLVKILNSDPSQVEELDALTKAAAGGPAVCAKINPKNELLQVIVTQPSS